MLFEFAKLIAAAYIFLIVGNMRLNTTYYPISLRSVLERHIEKSDGDHQRFTE